MTEKSYFWTTGTSGDGETTYTQVDLQRAMMVMAACGRWEGIAPDFLNKLEATAAGANTVTVKSGGAIVDGRPYYNDAPVNVNIPSASGAGNRRIDRIVLRASWSSYTVRITRIEGTNAPSPTPPTITQISGTTYDIQICQVLVDTAGAVTVTDERTFARIGTADIAPNAVTYAKIQQGNARSLLGVAGASTDNYGEIVAGADGHVMRRSGANIGFGQLALGAFPTGLFTADAAGRAPFAAGVITAAEIANRTIVESIPPIGAYDVTTSSWKYGDVPWLLINDNETYVLARFRLPSRYVSGFSITPVVRAEAGSGNIYVRTEVYAGAEGEAYDTHVNIGNYAAKAITVAYTLLDANAGTDISAGDWIEVRVRRAGAHAADTYTGRAIVVGFNLSYTADS